MREPYGRFSCCLFWVVLDPHITPNPNSQDPTKPQGPKARKHRSPRPENCSTILTEGQFHASGSSGILYALNLEPHALGPKPKLSTQER